MIDNKRHFNKSISCAQFLSIAKMNVYSVSVGWTHSLSHTHTHMHTLFLSFSLHLSINYASSAVVYFFFAFAIPSFWLPPRQHSITFEIHTYSSWDVCEAHSMHYKHIMSIKVSIPLDSHKILLSIIGGLRAEVQFENSNWWWPPCLQMHDKCIRSNSFYENGIIHYMVGFFDSDFECVCWVVIIK